MTYKSRELQLVEHLEIWQTKKGHWVFMRLPDTGRCGKKFDLGEKSWDSIQIDVTKLATYTPPGVLVRRFKDRLDKCAVTSYHVL
jgi:hypothetical protein